MPYNFYCDEAGRFGNVDRISPKDYGEISLICGVLFDPRDEGYVASQFQDLIRRQLWLENSKVHITDLPTNAKQEVIYATQKIFEKFNPIIIFSARRVSTAVNKYQIFQNSVNKFAPYPIRSSPAEKLDDELFRAFLTTLDIIAQCNLGLKQGEVNLCFDSLEKDTLHRYGKEIERQKNRGSSKFYVNGFDKLTRTRVRHDISTSTSDPFAGIDGAPDLRAISLGHLFSLKKSDPLIFSADIVANTLFRHLRVLGDQQPLNVRSAVMDSPFTKWIVCETQNSLSDLL